MKKTLLSLALLLACATAQAEPLTPEPCGTGGTAICSSPAPTVASLTYAASYGRITAVIDGELYDSGLYAVPAYALTWSVAVYTPAGDMRTVTATFSTTVTSVRSGRVTARVTHWELVSGSVD